MEVCSKKVLNRFRLLSQHFGSEVIHDVFVAAAKGRNQARHILPVSDRKRRHLQTGNPAFRAADQRADIFRGEFYSHSAPQKGRRFLRGETQVRLTQLGQLSACSQARQRQRRIFARRDGDMHLRRLMFEQKSEGLMNRRRRNQVIIVQHQNEWLGNVVKLINQDR